MKKTSLARECSLDTFSGYWPALLEAALVAKQTLTFTSPGEKKRFQVAFYSMKKALRGERPDLATRYSRIGAFTPPGQPLSLLVGIGRPGEDALERLGLEPIDWPEPQEPTMVATTAAGMVDLDRQLAALGFGQLPPEETEGS
jgi:hypothetical protein